MTPAREDRPDDRGPGGCDLGGLGRAGRCLRALGDRGALPLRPLRVGRWARASAASLDAWGTINALAARTTTLRLGTMVSPTSFRHPSVLAKLVDDRRPRLRRAHRARHRHRLVGDRAHRVRLPVPVDEGADGRARGAARDHPRRALQATARSASRATYYELEDLQARPLPVQQPAPAADHGRRRRPARGAARRPLRRRVQHGDADARARSRERKANIDAACEKAGREPIPFTVMTTCVIGADEADYDARGARSRR